MERPAKTKKLYQSASYVTSNAVFYGMLLFFVSRVFGFLQLFIDAYNRKKLGQAPPENFTVLGIIGSILVLGVITGAFLLLVQYRQKKLRLRKGNFFLLLNVLFVVWGVIQAINYLVEMILFFEFVYLLDFLTLLGALALPSVLLQLSDRKQEPVQEQILLYAGIGSTALSVIATLIVALVLRKSYTAFQLVRELMFRGGIILFGVAVLQKAIKLRSEPLPAYTPKPEAKKPAPKKTVLRDPVYTPDKSGKIECPDCGKKVAVGTAICPRCGYDMNTPSLFEEDEEEIITPPEEPEEEEVFVPEPEEPAPEPVKSDLCPRCGKKIPEPLVTCPRCGYYPGDSLEMPKEPEKTRPRARSKAEERRTETGTHLRQMRQKAPRQSRHLPLLRLSPLGRGARRRAGGRIRRLRRTGGRRPLPALRPAGCARHADLPALRLSLPGRDGTPPATRSAEAPARARPQVPHREEQHRLPRMRKALSRLAERLPLLRIQFV